MTIYECDRCGRQSKPDDKKFLDIAVVLAHSVMDNMYPDSPRSKVDFHSEQWCLDCRDELINKVQVTLNKFLEKKPQR